MAAPFLSHAGKLHVYFVYILVCKKTGRSYVGQTDNLLRRFQKHREGSSRWTREKLVEPFMAYWEAYPNRKEAMRRERYYKAGSGHRLRLELIGKALAAR